MDKLCPNCQSKEKPLIDLGNGKFYCPVCDITFEMVKGRATPEPKRTRIDEHGEKIEALERQVRKMGESMGVNVDEDY